DRLDLREVAAAFRGHLFGQFEHPPDDRLGAVARLCRRGSLDHHLPGLVHEPGLDVRAAQIQSDVPFHVATILSAESKPVKSTPAWLSDRPTRRINTQSAVDGRCSTCCGTPHPESIPVLPDRRPT